MQQISISECHLVMACPPGLGQDIPEMTTGQYGPFSVTQMYIYTMASDVYGSSKIHLKGRQEVKA